LGGQESCCDLRMSPSEQKAAENIDLWVRTIRRDENQRLFLLLGRYVVADVRGSMVPV
jgi:hypothetical protein